MGIVTFTDEDTGCLEFLLLRQNTMTNHKFGEEEIHLAHTFKLLFITKGNQDRKTAGQDPGSRN